MAQVATGLRLAALPPVGEEFSVQGYAAANFVLSLSPRGALSPTVETAIAIFKLLTIAATARALDAPPSWRRLAPPGAA